MGCSITRLESAGSPRVRARPHLVTTARNSTRTREAAPASLQARSLLCASVPGESARRGVSFLADGCAWPWVHNQTGTPTLLVLCRSE